MWITVKADGTLIIYLFTFIFTMFTLQAFMYEVRGKFEELTEVKVVWILCWDTSINACVPVKTLVTYTALLGVRCIQDMSDAKLL